MPAQASVLDLVIAALLLLLAVRGMVRGIVPELGGVLSVFIAVIASGNKALHDWAAGWLAPLLDDPGWADFIAYIGVFFIVFILLRLLFQALERAFGERAPGWIDRGLGGMAGAVKGLIACTVLLVCLSYVAPDSRLRQDSFLAPYFAGFWEEVSEFTNGVHKLPDLSAPEL